MIKLAEMKKLYNKKDKMHNFNHILRIKKNVDVLVKDYKKIDEKLLSFLILFHGLKDYVSKHRKEFPKAYIISLIRHSENPKLIEEKIVFDANMLDNVGKFGIKKALYFGNKIGRTRKQTFEYVKSNLGKIKFYTKEGNKIGKLKIVEMKKLISQ